MAEEPAEIAIDSSNIIATPAMRPGRKKVRRRRGMLQDKCPNSKKACRLCLRNGQIPISAQLASEIFFALDLRIKQDDTLPHLVCQTCSVRVHRFARFKRQVCLTQCRLTDENALKNMEEEQRSPVQKEDLAQAPWDVDEMHDGVGSLDENAEDAPSKQHSPFNCIKCKKAFNTQEDHNLHVTTRACSRQRAYARELFVCEVCGKACKTKSTLQNHCLVHTTELKYACDLCPYKARWRTALLHHTRVHTGERPVQCPLCPARFVSPSNLASHRRTHFPPQFKCKVCDRAFTNKQGLDNHMASQHSNVKAHVCNICDKSFSTRRLMRRHELKNHNCPKRRGGSTPVYIQLQRDTHHDASPQY